MRVLTLTTIYPNEQIDAEGRSVFLLDRALGELGVAGTTFVLKPWVPRWLAGHLDRWRHLAVRSRVEERQGVEVVFSHYLHVPVRYHLEMCVRSMAARAMRLIEENGTSFDLVHGECLYPASLAAHRVARAFQVPFVVTLRDALSHLSFLYEHRRARDLFEPMFSAAGAIFVIGPAQMRDLPDYVPAPGGPELILAPNGVDLKGLQAILESLPASPGPSGGGIVSVGHLFRFKGIHENLSALKLLEDRGVRDWQYTVVGDGPYRRELEGLCSQLGLEGKVNFMGRVPFGEAIRQVRNADIFSLPSHDEPFGNVFAEAAVCGRPAIGCRGSGAEMTIREGETGLLVPARNVEALADALAFLLTHPEEAKRMGEAGKSHIRQFTWARTARIYEEAFQRTLALRGRGEARA